jgi:RNA-directed DNA polymerase
MNNNFKGMIDYYETKEHPITKKMILDACKEIKANGNAAGVDGQRLEAYAQQLPRNLCKLWNTMTAFALLHCVLYYIEVLF